MELQVSMDGTKGASLNTSPWVVSPGEAEWGVAG